MQGTQWLAPPMLFGGTIPTATRLTVNPSIDQAGQSGSATE